MSFEPDKDPSLDGLADPQDPVPHARDPRDPRALEPLEPRDPRAVASVDDFAIEEDHLAQTVEVEVAQLGALASGADASRDPREKDRPSRKERVRPKITLRIPDDEVSRPEPSHTSTTAIPPVAEAADRVTARELEVDIDGTPATGVPHVEPGARTSPLPPRADSEDIEVSIPSTPFISVDSVDADPSEPGPFDLSASPAPVAVVAVVAPVAAVAPAGLAGARMPLVQTPAAPPAARVVVPSPADLAGLAGNESEPREFEALREGPFAEEDDESGWTPWQPTAIDLREAAASSRVDLDSSAIEEVEASPLSEEPDLIPVDSDDDPLPASNPPEIEPEDVLVEEAAAPPPVRPRAPSVPGLPPMRPQYVTPTSIGMESIPPDPLSGPGTAPVPPRPPPAPVNSAPQLHQVLAEGGPRVGSPQAAPASSPAVSAPVSAPSSDPSNNFSGVESKTEAKKRAKPWWEELFNDDYLRTVGAIKDSEIDAEVSFIEDSLGVAKGATVLDLACGTGRHAIELGRRGYQVVGFDLSLAMLARASDEAQERGQKLNFVQGDMREMTFEDAFDGIYCWQTSFGFFEEEKNTAVIGRVHRALRKGGQFLLDVVNRDYVAREAPSLVWFEGDGCICMDEMQMDFITSRLRVKRTMMIDDGRSKEIEYSVRAYSLHELGKMLNDAGFRVAEVTGKIQTPGVFFGCESPRIVILAEKR